MRNRVLLAVFVVCFLQTSLTRAQSASPPTEEFSAIRYVPAVGAGNYGMVDGALVAGDMDFSGLLIVDYAHRPFVIFEADCNADETDCTLNGFQRNIVAYQITTNIGGTVTFANRVQVGLLVPVVGTSGDGYHASRGAPDALPLRILGGQAFAIADPRLSAKVKIYGNGTQGFMLAGVAYGTAPVGRKLASGRGIGYDGFTGGGHLAGELRMNALRVGVNLGGVYRPRREILSTVSGSALTYGVAANVPLTSLLSVTAELDGTTRLNRQVDENTMEMRAFGQLDVSDFQILLGGGAGLVGGLGVPNFRVLGGAMYAPQSLDSDGDGVRDVDDRCPSAVEDMDGYVDDDGCPEADNDADGLLDEVDKCPDDAEDLDGQDDQDGCPDRDNDGDGIQDGFDSCPNEPEDMDGDRDEDGCPDNDRDRDGVEDDVDQCPDEMEDTDGFGDEDGCPEVDFDGDGIPDDEDQCPDEAEDMNGVEDDDGCPEVPASGSAEVID